MQDEAKTADFQSGWFSAIWRVLLICEEAGEDRRHHTYDLGQACAEEAKRIGRKVAALDPRAAAEEGDPNAPWLTQAHLLCSDQGIPHGRLEERLAALRRKLEGAERRTAA